MATIEALPLRWDPLVWSGEVNLSLEWFPVILEDDPDDPLTVLMHRSSYLRLFPFLQPRTELIYEQTEDREPFHSIDIPIVFAQQYGEGDLVPKKIQVDYRGATLRLQKRTGILVGWNSTTGKMESHLPQETFIIPSDIVHTSTRNILKQLDPAEEQEGETARGALTHGGSHLAHSTDETIIQNGGNPKNKLKQPKGWFGIPPDSERTRENDTSEKPPKTLPTKPTRFPARDEDEIEF